MSVKSLRERWLDAGLLEHGHAVLRGESSAGGLPSVDGLIDLRGIPAPPSATAEEPWRPPWIENVTLQGLDLSLARFAKVRLMDVELRDCVLDRADLRDAIVRGGGWFGCGLRGVTLRDVQVSEGEGRFRAEDCDLTKADGRCSRWRGVDLASVSFDDAKLGGAYFTRATLMSVSFAAADLREAGFGYDFSPEPGVSVRLGSCDFATARLEWTMFHATVVESCRFPSGTFLVPNYPAALRAALASRTTSAADRARLDEFRGIALRQGWGEESTAVILDPAPFMGEESPDGLELRVLRAAGVPIVEV